MGEGGGQSKCNVTFFGPLLNKNFPYWAVYSLGKVCILKNEKSYATQWEVSAIVTKCHMGDLKKSATFNLNGPKRFRKSLGPSPRFVKTGINCEGLENDLLRPLSTVQITWKLLISKLWLELVVVVVVVNDESINDWLVWKQSWLIEDF